MRSIKEQGVVLTDKRLVVYGKDAKGDASSLDAIRAIRFIPSTGWFGEGQFVIETDNGALIVFQIAGSEGGDQAFHDALRKRAAQAREAAGRPVPTEQTSGAPNAAPADSNSPPGT